MIETLKNAFRNKDIRKKIFMTFLLLLLFFCFSLFFFFLLLLLFLILFSGLRRSCGCGQSGCGKYCSDAGNSCCYICSGI